MNSDKDQHNILSNWQLYRIKRVLLSEEVCYLSCQCISVTHDRCEFNIKSGALEQHSLADNIKDISGMYFSILKEGLSQLERAHRCWKTRMCHPFSTSAQMLALLQNPEELLL